MYELIFRIFYPLIMSLIITIPIINLSFNKLSKKSLFIFTLVSYVLISFLSRNAPPKLMLPLFLIMATLYLYITYKKLIYSIIIAMFVLIIVSLGDAITGVIVMDILNII